ncbi:MAG: serine/threonine protein kinase [Microcoleus sp.]
MLDRVLKERYAIQQSLGKNAGRQTFLAQDLKTKQLVVIKILAFSADVCWDDLKLFKREAATLQSLDHPGIPHYLDCFEFETPKTRGFALVQSYIKAKSLAEWVEAGRSFSAPEIEQIAKSLLEILVYLQAQNPPVIHRDIKPSNILLADRSPVKQHSSLDRSGWLGEVYLVDFGSVQTLAAREGSTVTVVGTYGYMPPEQFGGRAVPASDLYGLGATLIYLVTGVHPADLPQEDLRLNFEPKIALSSDFIDWLQWMTEPDLNRRLTTADRALQELEKPGKGRWVVQKSAGSLVKLKKDRNSLEIITSYDYSYYISNEYNKYNGACVIMFYLIVGGVFCSFVFTIGVVVLGLIFAAIAIALSSGYFSHPFFAGMAVFLFVSFVVYLLELIVKIIFKKRTKSTRLRIDRQQISLTSNWLGFVRYNILPPSPISTICKLQVNNLRNSVAGRNIQIWVGTQEYQLITSYLKHREIDWIAREISEWLDLPIS